jgi:hypothetical protein
MLAAATAILIGGILLFAANLLKAVAIGGETAGQSLILENFESYGAGAFPEKWRMAKSDARKIYKVETESGNRFLRARSEKQGLQIALEHVFEPKQQRHLSWRWRAREFPTGADERIGDKHDTAAQVYVIFDNQILPRIIKYMWSSVVPAGARFTHPLYSRARVVIVRRGGLEPGKWFEEKINLYEDYKQFFNAEPGKAQVIALMSSSDSTNSVAGVDYDDFVLFL